MIQKHIQTCVAISQLQPEPHSFLQVAVDRCLRSSGEMCWNILKPARVQKPSYDLKCLEKTMTLNDPTLKLCNLSVEE